MRRVILIALALIVATVAHTETRGEAKSRLRAISQRCAEATDRKLNNEDPTRNCLRIGSLRDDLIRCATERHHLRRAAACPHLWHGIGPKAKGCAKCESIAHFVNGEWLVVYTQGVWVGPEPLTYPEEYNLQEK